MGHGDKKFGFSYLLPIDVPSSFASNFGRVIYQVKAEADLSRFSSQKRKVFFSVSSMYDLNLDPLATVSKGDGKESRVLQR